MGESSPVKVRSSWDRDGYVLWYKRLEVGVFKLPRVAPGAGSVELRASELAMLLDGIDMAKLKRVPRNEPPAQGVHNTQKQ
jgi:transposase